LKNPKSSIIIKLETLKPLMPHAACLKKPEKLKTIEIFKNNRVSSPKP
jgi:hypothetical protein